MPTNRAPLIVAILFLLVPLLYVGSYLALVDPSGKFHSVGNVLIWSHYRVGGKFVQGVYWPLEQIDRKVRPKAWHPASQW